MRIFFYLTLIGTSFFLINCGKDIEYFNVERVIINNSSVPVVWKVYDNSLLVDTILISATTESRKKERCQIGPRDYSCNLLSGEDIELFQQDSIFIEFDSKSIEKYCVNSVPCLNNRMNISLVVHPILESEQLNGFVRTIDSQNTRVYTYTITEEDYQNAKLIED